LIRQHGRKNGDFQRFDLRMRWPIGRLRGEQSAASVQCDNAQEQRTM
jgi:hypothetical protein